MPGCAAVNCTRQSKEGHRLFRFPASPRRRAKWLKFSRRAKWTPNSDSRLCEVHFEQSQYETYSLKEGEIPKLRKTSVPTLFDVPNPSKCLEPKRRARKRTNTEIQPEDSETSDQLVYHSEHNYFKKNKKDPSQVLVLSQDWELEVATALNLEPREEAAGNQQFTIVDKNIVSNNELGPNCSGGVDTYDLILSPDGEQEVFAVPHFEPHGEATTCSTSLDNNVADKPSFTSPDKPDDNNLINNEPSLNVQNAHVVNTPRTHSRQKTLSKKCLQQHIWRLQKQVTKLKKENQTIRSSVNSRLGFLSAEQTKYLLSGKKNKKYTPEIIKDAIQIRFAVGWKGYKYLVQRGYPLPSYSTICRKLQTIDFSPGLLHDILFYLQIKSKTSSIKERDCIMMIDEMEISKGLELMPGMRKYVGKCTVGNDKRKMEDASQLLVVMIRGLTSNWKQVIGYHLLNKKNDDSLATFVKDAVDAVHEAGYNVRGFVSDMGPKNQAIWRSFGLYPGRFCKEFDVVHPVNKDDRLFMFADAPHLLKNLKQALLTHNITIPEDTVKLEKLDYNKVDAKYLKELIRIQKDNNLKLAPNLTERHLDPNQFEKMKVSMATQVFCEKTASALETLVQLNLMSKKALTTAWFLRKVRSWFDVMNSRDRKKGIHRKNKGKNIKTLSSIVTLFRNITFGEGRWKPVQTGVILTTINVIGLVRKLFSEGYGYVLTTRLNQDGLESLFSVLRRHGNNHPSALQAVQALKLITVSQFIEKIGEKSQNYEEDNDNHYVALFSSTTKPTRQDSNTSAFAQCCRSPNTSCFESSDDSDDETPLSLVEKNALNNLLGTATKTVLQRNQLCSSCKEDVVNRKGSGRVEETVINLRSKGGLLYPSQNMFDHIQVAEGIITRHLKTCQLHANLLQHLVVKVHEKTIPRSVGLNCSANCKAMEAITKQLIRLRLHIHAAKSKENAKIAGRKRCFASKSANRVVDIPYELSLLGYQPPSHESV